MTEEKEKESVFSVRVGFISFIVRGLITTETPVRILGEEEEEEEETV